MSTQKVYVGDTGTAVIIDCGQDISAATLRSVEMLRPDNFPVSVAASASGANSITFTTLSGTFDTAGVWKLQPKVTLPTGVWRGETVSLVIYAPFG